MANMNVKVLKEGDVYHACFTDPEQYGIFGGSGPTISAAIGQCFISNRESIGLIIEVHELGKDIIYILPSTDYLETPRTPE